MAKEREKTGETLKFALKLLESLESRTTKTAENLKNELADSGIDRDIRSVQRMLTTISDLYEPSLIDAIRTQKPYGYRWSRDAKKLLIPGMTEMEAVFIELAYKYLARLIPLHRPSAAYKDEASLVLKANKTDPNIREWSNKVYLVHPTQPLIPPDIDDRILDTVEDCLFTNHYLRIVYRNQFGEESDIVVQPLALIDRAPFCYLVSFKLNEYNEPVKDPHPYALHRIVQATSLANRGSFETPTDFDLAKYVEEERYVYGSGEKITITFDIKKKAGHHITEAQLSKDQQVEEIEKNGVAFYRIEAEVNNSLTTYVWLRGFGDQVENVKGLPDFESLFPGYMEPD